MKKYEETSNKKSCSMWAIILVLVAIMLALLGGVFYFKYKIKDIDIKNPFSLESVDKSLQKQLSDQAGEKEVTLTIKEADLESAINADSAEFPLKNASVKITSDKIILSGRTSNSPFSFKLDVGIIPVVSNGSVMFTITEIKTAGVAAPKVITDKVNNELKSYLENSSSVLSKDIDVKSVKLNSGFLTATGQRKS